MSGQWVLGKPALPRTRALLQSGARVRQIQSFSPHVLTVEAYVRNAFLAALMLTGTIEGAEQAVSDATATSG